MTFFWAAAISAAFGRVRGANHGCGFGYLKTNSEGCLSRIGIRNCTTATNRFDHNRAEICIEHKADMKNRG